jgi:hypothetical protein
MHFPDIVSSVLSAVRTILWLSGFGCWLTMVVSMFQVVAQRQPGLPVWPNAWESPFNWLFRPSQLTPAGLRSRKRCFAAAVGFVVCVALCVLTAAEAGVTR